MRIENIFTERKEREAKASPKEIVQIERDFALSIKEEKDQLSPIDRVFLARYQERPKGKEYIENLIEDPIFLRGDRAFADDESILTGIGKFSGQVISFIAIEKGREVEEKIRCNFGMVHPEGYRKAVRAMKQAEKFQRPLLIFIDTPGAYPGKGAEERGQGESIASSIYTMTKLRTPIISVITGEGASGGAISLAVCDRLIMLENAIYSILSPEGFASILWRDSNRVHEAMEKMKLTAQDLYQAGIAENLVREDIAYDGRDFKNNYLRLRVAIEDSLEELSKMDIDEMLVRRREKFRREKWELE